jgi:hypothetical protein
MSSSRTNKQPLLVDRPLHEFAILGPTPALQDPANFSTVLGGGCVRLVDCSAEDGAVVDSISVVANQQSTSAVRVLFFLSTSPTPLGINDTNTALVAVATVRSTTAGERVNVSLPSLSVPVPTLQGIFATTEEGADPGDPEVAKKNNGLYVPAGKVLYTGLSLAITAPTPATRVNVFAQGGFF